MELEDLKYLSFFGPITTAQHDDDDLESTRLIQYNIFEKITITNKLRRMRPL